ncbi:oligosaccharide flippase family protein [Paracoccus cavernae]|uniref:Oligosaccharide flippase family protein n=1 Tax=Paracoccus cavernae TaxID=1571207 RepID=A0ABT8D8V9_9RHOB|nr:oligosaccharide flippase family protein [Paracoccus cavernae]
MGGSILSIIGFGGGQFMRLLSNLLLTRILSPDDFGLMTLVTGFLIGLTMFSDMGLGPRSSKANAAMIRRFWIRLGR